MNLLAETNKLPDVQEGSARNLIAVVFPKSKSPSYEMVVEFAKKATAYGEREMGGRLFHYALFGLDKTQAQLAISVVEVVKDWKETKLFTQGRLLERKYNVVETLRCYLNSFEVSDAKAHCHFIYRDLSFSLFNSLKGRYLIPCRMLEGFTHGLINDAVSNPQDSIKAAAVQRGSFWCPRFDPSFFDALNLERKALADKEAQN
jgi:hypothetical protein